ncbi:hypothetical protein ACWDSJ_05760 [Nocardia sp. NPDC003482]
MTGEQGAATGVDKILETGRAGLRFFTDYVPRYRDWTGRDPAGLDENALLARYDQQRGMDVEPLRAFAGVLSGILTESVGDHVGTQQSRFAELPARWTDSAAADNAAQYVRRVGNQIGQDHETLGVVAQAVSTAADTLEEIVRTKADAVRTDLTTKTVAGKSGEQVASIAAYARGNFGTATDDDARAELVRQVLPEFVSGDPQAFCGQWMNAVFVPAVDNTVSAYVGLNDATHTAVGGLYEQLAGALESVGSEVYRSPDGTPSATTDLGTNAADALYSGQRLSGDPVAATPVAATTAAPADAATGDKTGSGAQDQGSKTSSAGEGQTPAPNTPATPGTPTEPATPSTPTGTASTLTTTVTGDMGQQGVWRPGDITNAITAASQITGNVPDILTHLGDPLKAVGSTAESFGNAAKSFGEAFKDVVGSDGITGLVKEGVDAAERIDKIVEHHANPADTTEPATPGQNIDTGRETGTDATAKPVENPPTDKSGQQNPPTNSAPAQPNPAQPVISTHSAPPVETPAHPGTTPAPAPSNGPVIGPSLASVSADDETEHRSKVNYTTSALAMDPDEFHYETIQR